MDHRCSQDEDNMLDFEGKMIEPKDRNTELFPPSDYDPAYNISKVNVVHGILSKISSLNINDGKLDKLPDNIYYYNDKDS